MAGAGAWALAVCMASAACMIAATSPDAAALMASDWARLAGADECAEVGQDWGVSALMAVAAVKRRA